MSETTKHAWGDRWPDSLKAAVNTLGFSSILDLLRENEGVTYRDLGERLGGIPPIQLIALAFQEANERQELKYILIDSLCRNIVEKCPGGWGTGDNPDSDKRLALAAWMTRVTSTGSLPHLQETASAIARALLNCDVAEGWLPTSNSDPILETVVSDYWSEQ